MVCSGCRSAEQDLLMHPSLQETSAPLDFTYCSNKSDNARPSINDPRACAPRGVLQGVVIMASRERLRALEFYAGVGGFHYSLLRSEVNAEVSGSFDLNPTANKIYTHNFPNTSHYNRNICGLTASELDNLEPDIIHMSPPCQPFTRQGLRRDKEDRRTDSFFHLMLTISEMRKPPNYILMENVQGFESSHTRNEFTQTLERVGYSYQEFLLSPVQFGVPNSRLRYYLLGKKKPLSFALKPASGDANTLVDFVRQLPCSTETEKGL